MFIDFNCCQLTSRFQGISDNKTSSAKCSENIICLGVGLVALKAYVKHGAAIFTPDYQRKVNVLVST